MKLKLEFVFANGSTYYMNRLESPRSRPMAAYFQKVEGLVWHFRITHINYFEHF